MNSSLFFFSSRRRHTRYWRDWSSDVCSSDLRIVIEGRGADEPLTPARDPASLARNRRVEITIEGSRLQADAALETAAPESRSEERRVGKECRSRWSPYH